MLEFVFPLVCPGCGRASGRPVCPECAAELRAPPRVGPPDGIDAWAAAFAYEGVAREVVARVKYRNVRAVVPWLAGRMVAAATDAGLAEVDAAVWAPTTAERRRRRGFDAAELLARAVARRLHVPAAALLERLPGPPQTGLVGAARRVGPGFTARQGVPGAVVLVDDVATTGATLAAAARALRATGARCVVAVTAARTPAPGDGPIGSCVYSAEGADS